MAASLSQGTRASAQAERFHLLRELGARAIPVWAARDSAPNAREPIVVVQRLSRRGVYGEAEIGSWESNARRLATLEHPNVPRTREVVMRRDDVLVVSDYVDGVRWSELSLSPQPPSLELSLRVLVDVLAGLSAIHNLRDAKRQPLGLVHGELTPECVLVGLDGVARVVDVRPTRLGAAGCTEAACGYLAPEVLLADDAADPRADVYSVGAMLWEALSGRPLFARTSAGAIVTQILSGQVPRAVPPASAAWATPLVDAAARALSADPAKRFPSAAALAADLRRVAGPRLALTPRLGAHVRAECGDRIQLRRQALERSEDRGHEVSVMESRGEYSSIDVPIDVEVDFNVPGASDPDPFPNPSRRAATTTRPPPLMAAPIPPVPPRPLRPPALPPPKAPPLRAPIGDTPPPAASPLPTENVASRITLEDTTKLHLAKRRALAQRAAAVAAGVLVVSLALAWWLAPRRGGPAPSAAASTSPTPGSMHPASRPQPAPNAPVPPPPPAEPSTPAPPSADPAAPQSVANAPAGTPQTPARAGTPGFSARAAPKPKYDPQGI